MAIINEKNEIFNSVKEYKSSGDSISMHKVKELLDTSKFWAFNGFDVNTLHRGQQIVITKEGNCIRRLTPSGYVTIALKTIKKTTPHRVCREFRLVPTAFSLIMITF